MSFILATPGLLRASRQQNPHHAAARLRSGSAARALLAALLIFTGVPVVGESRRVVSLDWNWCFRRGDLAGVQWDRATADGRDPAVDPIHPDYNDSGWQRVNVPHDYVVEGSFDPKADALHASLPVEPAWYRKRIDLPERATGRRFWLEFDGVYRDSRMWLNGRFLGRHQSGYTSFRYDITDAARPGDHNVLTVRVDPTAFEGWWYEGGGIYRHTRLVSVAPVHIAPWGVHVVATVPHPADGRRADAVVTVTTCVENQDRNPVDVTLLTEIIDTAGASVGRTRGRATIPEGRADELGNSVKIAQARLWSSDHPELYRLRSTLRRGGRTIDEVTTTFGIRTAYFDPDRGFLLNGQPIRLKGTCNHQDFAGVGIALPDRIHESRVRRLKEMGANAYRFSHHPMAPELLDVCDRLGMLVLNENRYLGDLDEILGQLKGLVLRDRNHPSVILWSLCNEEKEQGTELGARQARAMVEVIRGLDPTRPITAAMNGGFGSGLAEVVDVLGINYHSQDYDWVHEKFPRKPVVGTETSAAVGTRGVYARQTFTQGSDPYEGDVASGHLAAYGVNAPSWGAKAEPAWQAIVRRPWIAGAFVWTGFDYRGEPTPFGWPSVGSQFGILDLCGFPKDAFFFYQAWWSERPVLHVFPHWNWPGWEGREITVWVYSNCHEVELFLNGRSVGNQLMPLHGHLEWKVPYAPGQLLARGRRDGREFTAAVETSGPPVALMLEPDRTTLAAKGGDVSLVAVRVVDDVGRTVPTASNEVTFSIRGAGRLLGVGNGDPTSHESDRASHRRVFNGLSLAILQADDTSGNLTLRAESEGLRPASVRLHVR